MKQHNWELARASDEIGHPAILVNIDNDIQIRLPDEEQARLVAASPDMYEALKKLNEAIEVMGDYRITYKVELTSDIIESVMAALAKAEDKNV
jgi:hypothetical protein